MANCNKSTCNNKVVGNWGEDYACRYLQAAGYKILERNVFAHCARSQRGRKQRPKCSSAGECGTHKRLASNADPSNSTAGSAATSNCTAGQAGMSNSTVAQAGMSDSKAGSAATSNHIAGQVRTSNSKAGQAGMSNSKAGQAGMSNSKADLAVTSNHIAGQARTSNNSSDIRGREESESERSAQNSVSTPGRIIAELDIVAQEGNTLVFVEVKTRRGTRWGDPLESITPRKVAQLYLAAECYLRDRGLEHRKVRFDAIGITRHPEGWKLRHIKDIRN